MAIWCTVGDRPARPQDVCDIKLATDCGRLGINIHNNISYSHLTMQKGSICPVNYNWADICSFAKSHLTGNVDEQIDTITYNLRLPSQATSNWVNLSILYQVSARHI